MSKHDTVHEAEHQALKKRLAELEAENRELSQDVLRYQSWLGGQPTSDDADSKSTAELQMDLVYAKAPIIFWSMDRDGIFTESRGRGLQLIGLREGEAVGASVWQMYREYPEILATIRRALDGEELSETVYLDGAFFDTYYSPIYASSGSEPIGVRGMSVVVTDREIARTAFQQTGAVFRDLFTEKTLGLLVLKEDTLDVVSANLEFLVIVDRDSTDLVGRSLTELGVFKDSELIATIQDEVAATAHFNAVDTTFLTKKGGELSVRVAADRLRIANEQYVVLSVQNTTQRRRVLQLFEEHQAELNAELRQPFADWKQFAGELQSLIQRRTSRVVEDVESEASSESRFSESALHYFLECVPDTVCTIDRTGTILYLNHTHLTTQTEDIVGASAYDLVSPQYAEESRAVIERVFETGEIMTHQIESPGPDGVTRHYSCRIGPMRRFGRVRAVIVVATDVTRLHEAQEAIRRRQLEFERLAQLTSLGQMATMVAHEVNNPLAAIANYAQGCIRRIQQMMSEPVETVGESFRSQASGLVGALEDTTEQAKQASGSIHRLRRFLSSRGSASHTVATTQIIREAVDWVTPIVRASGVDLHVEMAETLPLVAADPLQIEQVLVHLILNGVDAVAESGQNTTDYKMARSVRLLAEVQGDSRVLFTIEDTGPGLSQTVLDNLFQPFYTTKKTGFGMGLTMSKAIVEQYGGRLWWDDQSTSGAVFHFELPISQGEPPRVQ